MRRSLPATAARTIRRAVTWRPKSPGHEVVGIEWLISPLRYDVHIRAAMFEAIATRPADEPIEDFLTRSENHPYVVWFREIEAARFRPWLLKDDAALRADYRERVRKAVDTFASFSKTGYDTRYPVTLRSTRGEQSTDTGLPFGRSLHVGDGGHRLALLLRAGSALEPAMYRVDPRPRPVLDNTSILLRHVPLSEADYVAFVAPGYLFGAGAQGPHTLEALEKAVAEQAPERITELRRIVDAHERARSAYQSSGGNHG